MAFVRAAALLAVVLGAPPLLAADAAAAFRWEGLSRRNPGLVVFRSRWNPGVLELRDDLVRWSDRTNPGKNLVLPVRRLLGHTLVCGHAPAAPCAEWRLVTKTETYVFRETSAEGAGALRRVFDAVRAAYGEIPSNEER